LSRFQKLSLLLFVVFIVGSSTATSALAFALGGSPWPTDVPCSVNCGTVPHTINYTIGNITDGSILMPDGNPLPSPLIRASIEKALWFWTTAVDIHFVEVPDGPLTQLRFRHLFINGPDPAPPALPIAKAQATCIGYGFGCEVQYDDSDRWQESGTTPNPDILGATIHEVGHIIGLNHSDVTSANMYWIFHRYSGLNSPELAPANIPLQFGDDIQGIQLIYGAGTGSVTPIGVPEPATAFLLTAALMCGLPIRRRR
jgi:Matrixin